MPSGNPTSSSLPDAGSSHRGRQASRPRPIPLTSAGRSARGRGRGAAAPRAPGSGGPRRPRTAAKATTASPRATAPRHALMKCAIVAPSLLIAAGPRRGPRSGSARPIRPVPAGRTAILPAPPKVARSGAIRRPAGSGATLAPGFGRVLANAGAHPGRPRGSPGAPRPGSDFAAGAGPAVGSNDPSPRLTPGGLPIRERSTGSPLPGAIPHSGGARFRRRTNAGCRPSPRDRHGSTGLSRITRGPDPLLQQLVIRQAGDRPRPVERAQVLEDGPTRLTARHESGSPVGATAFPIVPTRGRCPANFFQGARISRAGDGEEESATASEEGPPPTLHGEGREERGSRRSVFDHRSYVATGGGMMKGGSSRRGGAPRRDEAGAAIDRGGRRGRAYALSLWKWISWSRR
jgi:hypothetical protein